MERLEASDASMRAAQLRVLGGAMARVPADATAFAHRASRIMVNVAAFYEGPDERIAREAWVDGFAAALHQGDDGAYVNFLSTRDGPASAGVSRGDLGPARRDQAALRPGEPVPAEPEHPARLSHCRGRSAGLRRPRAPTRGSALVQRPHGVRCARVVGAWVGSGSPIVIRRG